MVLSRRAFAGGLAGLGASAVWLATGGGSGLLPASQAPGKRQARIGYLYAASEAAGKPAFDAFEDGLREYGWVPSDNLMPSAKYTDKSSEQLATQVRELLGEHLDLLVGGGSTAAEALAAATRNIPIVMLYVADPVGSGLVASLAHPSGNVTGVAGGVGQGLVAKRLELLGGWAPGLRRVGYLTSLRTQSARLYATAVEDAAKTAGLEVRVQDAGRVEDIEPGLLALAAWPVDGMLIENYSPLSGTRELPIQWAARQHVVALYMNRIWVEVGGLAYYGADARAVFRRGAYYVDRILRGASAADLPVEQPTLFEFVVKRATVQALGLTIPPNVASQVTEWLE